LLTRNSSTNNGRQVKNLVCNERDKRAAKVHNLNNWDFKAMYKKIRLISSLLLTP